MRVVTLSDHTGDMLTEAVRERERGTDEQQATVAHLQRDRAQARAGGHWLTWLRLTFALRRAKRELATARLLARAPTNREASIKAGRDAEQRVADALRRALGDGWILYRGYRNRRGEIDGLLLGPGGLFAYEVKYHNATVYVSGDEWLSERYQGNGRAPVRVPMQDARGRSPSQQIAEPAAALADWLRKRGQETTVTSVVLLTHDRARVGSMTHPTVLVATSADGLLRLIERSPVKLDARRRAAIAQIISDDHRHHEQRRHEQRRHEQRPS